MMKRIGIAAVSALMLAACDQKGPDGAADAPSPAATPAVETPASAATPAVETTAPVAAQSAQTPASTPLPYTKSSVAPADDSAVVDFNKIAEQYKGKQVPVDTDPATGQPVYFPLESVIADVQKTDGAEVPYIGIISMRVPNPNNVNSVYILVATYHYKDSQWKFESATEELQGGGEDKVFEQPVFKPELLK